MATEENASDDALDETDEGDARGDGSSRSLARRAGVVAIGTLASRILGAARDAVLAAIFPKAATDAFVVAFTIPNALRVLLGEGAVSGAFVPVLTDVREREGEARARSFLQHLSGAMVLVLALVTALGVATAPWLVEGYAGGYDGTRFDTTIGLTRWVFPYIFFMGLAALATGTLNASRQFAVPAFAPIFLNIALIGAAFGVTPLLRSSQWPTVYALAFGALAGGALQLAFQLPALRSVGMLRIPWPKLSDPAVRRAFTLLVPLPTRAPLPLRGPASSRTRPTRRS